MPAAIDPPLRGCAQKRRLICLDVVVEKLCRRKWSAVDRYITDLLVPPDPVL